MNIWCSSQSFLQIQGALNKGLEFGGCGTRAERTVGTALHIDEWSSGVLTATGLWAQHPSSPSNAWGQSISSLLIPTNSGWSWNFGEDLMNMTTWRYHTFTFWVWQCERGFYHYKSVGDTKLIAHNLPGVFVSSNGILLLKWSGLGCGGNFSPTPVKCEKKAWFFRAR